MDKNITLQFLTFMYQIEIVLKRKPNGSRLANFDLESVSQWAFMLSQIGDQMNTF